MPDTDSKIQLGKNRPGITNCYMFSNCKATY